MTTATQHLIAPGHRACSGCGLLVGARLATNASGGRVIIANATGCLEVTTTTFPTSSWRVPWIHSVFGNAAAVASGIRAGLRAQGRDDIPVIAQAGDGGTADIGLQALSGMLERGDDVLFICYDNEGYMNTGVQRSGLTPLNAATTTTPSGNAHAKKDLLGIVLAHHPAYAATATIAYHKDLERKMQRALQTKGPRYLHVLTPCPLGWRFDASKSIAVSRLAVMSNLFPLVEWRNGTLEKVKRIAVPVSVDEYLRAQGRFGHLFSGDGGEIERSRVQAIADENARVYGLPLYKPEEAS